MSDTKRLALDVGMLAAVVLAMVPGVTGVVLHEWIGFALLVPALLHLAINWDWVMHVIDQLFDTARNASRLNLLVDTLLFVSFVAVSLSGVMITPLVRDGLGGNIAYAWYSVHSASANATLALAVTHLALHARWFTRVANRLAKPLSPSVPPVAPLATATGKDAS